MMRRETSALGANTKKIRTLIAVTLLTIVLVGCASSQKNAQAQIEKITSLAEILAKTAELPQQYQRSEITLDQLKSMTMQLQDKYEQLTQNVLEESSDAVSRLQKTLDEQFAGIQQTLQEAEKKTGLPDRAIALGLTEPEGLALLSAQSRQTYVNEEGFDGVTLAYAGEYEQSLQQAKNIAEKANIAVSPEFQKAQEALSGLTAEEIAQITSGDMLKGIVYTNAGLLDTNIEYLITISVDENGKLIIEATNFSQMKK